jgi:hypothetical protein
MSGSFLQQGIQLHLKKKAQSIIQATVILNTVILDKVKVSPWPKYFTMMVYWEYGCKDPYILDLDSVWK